MPSLTPRGIYIEVPVYVISIFSTTPLDCSTQPGLVPAKQLLELSARVSHSCRVGEPVLAGFRSDLNSLAFAGTPTILTVSSTATLNVVVPLVLTQSSFVITLRIASSGQGEGLRVSVTLGA